MKTHKHHIIYKSQGGSNDPSNLVELDFIEHARLHALDFLQGGPQFDHRHEGYPYLSPELKELIRLECSRRTTERNLKDNPAKKAEVRQKMSEFGKTLVGSKNPFFNKNHTPESLEKIKKARLESNPRRRAKPIVLIHPDGTEETFDAALDACLKYNLSKGNLSSVLNGHSPKTKGYSARFQVLM
jgi:hypothetical protein